MICMSSLVPPAKVHGIKALDAEVRIVGTSQDEALAESLRPVGAYSVRRRWCSARGERYQIAGRPRFYHMPSRDRARVASG